MPLFDSMVHTAASVLPFIDGDLSFQKLLSHVRTTDTTKLIGEGVLVVAVCKTTGDAVRGVHRRIKRTTHRLRKSAHHVVHAVDGWLSDTVPCGRCPFNPPIRPHVSALAHLPTKLPVDPRGASAKISEIERKGDSKKPRTEKTMSDDPRYVIARFQTHASRRTKARAFRTVSEACAYFLPHRDELTSLHIEVHMAGEDLGKETWIRDLNNALS